MKIGRVHCLYDGPLPYKPGAKISFGPFVSARSAPEFCPVMFFEFPIRRAVTAIEWVAPTGPRSFYSSWELFDWSLMSPIWEVDGESDGVCPEFAEICPKPTTMMSKRLSCARDYWEPFTSLTSASKLLPTVLKMSEGERGEFMERLGQSRNVATLRVRNENYLIAIKWQDWEEHEVKYKDRLQDMEHHGLPMTEASFKKRVGSRALDLPSLFRE